jgi:outer membrane receptor protein involved in Fe transport
LFLPQGFNLFDMDEDPCGIALGRPSPARSLSDCQRSGITPTTYATNLDSPAGQYNFLQGGNPDLVPEKSDTYSLGVVWTPEFADGLSVSLDYYDIEIKQGINNLNPDFILNECLDGDTTQCVKVNRSSARGDLWIGSDVNASGHVVALNDNLAIERVKGVDLIVGYTWEAGSMGFMSINNNMGIIDTWDQTELEGAEKVSCKGIWGGSCGYPTPDFQNNLRYTWTMPWDVSASVMWRHISSIDDFTSNDITLGSVNYFDIGATWDITGNIQARLGITNLFDEEPPIAGANAGSASQGNGNIYPGMYDFLGRYMFIGVQFGT